MWAKAMREFLLTCPKLSGRELNLNYLGHKEGCFSLDVLGSADVVKTYCDGKRVLSCDYSIGMRCGFDENTNLNIKDAELMEAIALWLEQQGVIGNLPYLADGYRAAMLTVKKMPHLFESSIQGARMQLEFTLVYREI